MACPANALLTDLQQKVHEAQAGNSPGSIQTVATPFFSPTSGTYQANQPITITDATPGATIRFTYTSVTGGTPSVPPDPTSASPVYSTITVSGNLTTMIIKAIATESGMTNSSVATATYTINYSQVSTPQISLNSGFYSSTQLVTIGFLPPGVTGATIVYTTDGSVPAESGGLITHGSQYTAPFNVSVTEEVQAIGYKSGLTDSTVAIATYTLPDATPTFSLPAGNYSSAQIVSISTTFPGTSSINYTTDGTAPTSTHGQPYLGPISVTVNETLQAIAYELGWAPSEVATAAYTFTVATPQFSPAGGPYASDQSITISSFTPGATIYYTTNGSTPTTSSPVYSTAISVPGPSTTETVQALATKSGWTNSAVASATYIINTPFFWTQTGAASTTWSSIACSSDGTHLAAVDIYGDIITSTDSGATWTARTPPANETLSSIASSFDGTHLAVGAGPYIFTSTDSGATWTSYYGIGGAVASSSNGTHLAVAGGSIWTSTNSGATWNNKTPYSAPTWIATSVTPSIASSSDGTHLAVVVQNGDIWTSTDSGATWTDQAAAGARHWSSIASSSDGTHLAAAVGPASGQVGTPGDIYTSTDSGATWTAQTAAGSQLWSSIASSSDGTYLAATAGSVSGFSPGDIYTSTDSGATWAAQTAAGSKFWSSIASCSDGHKLAAAAQDDPGFATGGIWTRAQVP